MKITTTRERLMALTRTAFLPLETHASLEDGGHYQIRVLRESRDLHIEEMPADEVRDERDLTAWMGRMRNRLEERGFRLEPWEQMAEAR